MPICDHCGGLNAAEARQCEKCGAALAPVAQGSEAATSSAAELSQHDAELVALLREGRKIDAIKLHREATRVGLKEAKDYVESLGIRQGIPQAKGCGAATLALIVLLFGSLSAIMALWLP